VKLPYSTTSARKNALSEGVPDDLKGALSRGEHPRFMRYMGMDIPVIYRDERRAA
jgi:hypothetical protein